MQYISLGSAPAEENCSQVGSEGYAGRARRECRAYREQLLRWLTAQGKMPEYIELYRTGAIALNIHRNPHDFGTYMEVSVGFEEDNETACQLAILLEGEAPAVWDDEARNLLGR